jgi:hypothetical protein
VSTALSVHNTNRSWASRPCSPEPRQPSWSVLRLRSHASIRRPPSSYPVGLDHTRSARRSGDFSAASETRTGLSFHQSRRQRCAKYSLSRSHRGSTAERATVETRCLKNDPRAPRCAGREWRRWDLQLRLLPSVERVRLLRADANAHPRVLRAAVPGAGARVRARCIGVQPQQIRMTGNHVDLASTLWHTEIVNPRLPGDSGLSRKRAGSLLRRGDGRPGVFPANAGRYVRLRARPTMKAGAA